MIIVPNKSSLWFSIGLYDIDKFEKSLSFNSFIFNFSEPIAFSLWFFFSSRSSFLIENKYAPCIGDNADLRVILSVLYTIIEVVRCYETEVNANRLVAKPGYNSKFANIKKHLTNDLSMGLFFNSGWFYFINKNFFNSDKPLAKTNELFSVYLFQMISKFCNQNIIVLPIKKIILTLWKVLLVSRKYFKYLIV